MADAFGSPGSPGKPAQACRYSELEGALTALHTVIAPSFARAEPRQRALHYMMGLSGMLSRPPARKRSIGAYSREPRGDGAQRLLTTARWNEFEARSNLLRYVQPVAGANGDLFVTEVSFPKRGGTAVAVDRQFSVDTGQAENCQTAMLLFYVIAGKLYLLDADLYFSPRWAGPGGPLREPVPAERVERSKSTIARQMIDDALRAGFDPDWVMLHLFCPDKLGLLRSLRCAGVEHLAVLTPGESLDLDRTGLTPGMVLTDPIHVTGSFGRIATTLYYRGCARPPLARENLHRVINRMRTAVDRWRATRRRVHIDDYEVRSWRGWHRHMTLAMAVQIAMSGR